MQAMKPTASRLADGSHRFYQDQGGGTDTVFCRVMDNENDLLRLAAGIDGIAWRQAPGAGCAPTLVIESLIENLRCITRMSESHDPRAERAEREARGRIVDTMARIRIRHNRHVLAGVTRIFRDGVDEQHVLLIVLARKGVRSCEWRLAE